MLFFCFLLLGQPVQVQAAQKMFVQGESLQAREQPNPASPVSFTLSKGQAVDTLEGKGIWIRIKHSGKEAWVPLISLSKSKVASPESLLNTDSQIEKNSRRRSNAVATAGAARGLLASEDSLLAKVPRTNFRALKTMTQFRVPPENAKEFVK